MHGNTSLFIRKIIKDLTFNNFLIKLKILSLHPALINIFLDYSFLIYIEDSFSIIASYLAASFHLDLKNENLRW